MLTLGIEAILITFRGVRLGESFVQLEVEDLVANPLHFLEISFGPREAQAKAALNHIQIRGVLLPR